MKLKYIQLDKLDKEEMGEITPLLKTLAETDQKTKDMMYYLEMIPIECFGEYDIDYGSCSKPYANGAGLYCINCRYYCENIKAKIKKGE